MVKRIVDFFGEN
uniref:Uncharacterized protein n=1 Tax=Anguilla anguilla TaxID=7936 RepID=A0A0E9RYH5_ANGAN